MPSRTCFICRKEKYKRNVFEYKTSKVNTLPIGHQIPKTSFKFISQGYFHYSNETHNES